MTPGSSPTHPDPPEIVRAWTARPAWVLEAACRGMDPALFYPERGHDSTQAKQVCATCPVVEPCRQTAIENRELGIWGATSAKQRRREHVRCVPVIVHGTASGYQSHRRRGEAACVECLRAHADYKAGYKQERRSA